MQKGLKRLNQGGFGASHQWTNRRIYDTVSLFDKVKHKDQV